jgi:hypothetical protein
MFERPCSIFLPNGNIFTRLLKNLIHYPPKQVNLSRLCNPTELNFYRPLVGLAWVKHEPAGQG